MPAGSILGSDKEATSAESWGVEKTGTKQTIYYNPILARAPKCDVAVGCRSP